MELQYGIIQKRNIKRTHERISIRLFKNKLYKNPRFKVEECFEIVICTLVYMCLFVLFGTILEALDSYFLSQIFYICGIGCVVIAFFIVIYFICGYLCDKPQTGTLRIDEQGVEINKRVFLWQEIKVVVIGKYNFGLLLKNKKDIWIDCQYSDHSQILDEICQYYQNQDVYIKDHSVIERVMIDYHQGSSRHVQLHNRYRRKTGYLYFERDHLYFEPRILYLIRVKNHGFQIDMKDIEQIEKTKEPFRIIIEMKDGRDFVFATLRRKRLIQHISLTQVNKGITKKVHRILLSILFVLYFLLMGLFFYTFHIIQIEEQLTNEIYEISSGNVYSEDIDMTPTMEDEYAQIELAAKKYYYDYKRYYENYYDVEHVDDYYSRYFSGKHIAMLHMNYQDALDELEENQTQYNQNVDKIISLFERDTMLQYAYDQNIEDEYDLEYYLTLVENDTDDDVLKEWKQDQKRTNEKYEVMKEIIEFLKAHDQQWSYEGSQIVFEDGLEQQYNEFIEKLENIDTY